MTKYFLPTALFTAALMSTSGALCGDVRSVTVIGTSLGMPVKQIISKVSVELASPPSIFEYPTYNIAHFGQSHECGWMRDALSTPACIGYRVVSLNQGGDNYTASAINLYQRFEAPIDAIAFKKKLVQEYGHPDFASVPLDTYDELFTNPVFMWSNEAKNASQEVLQKMRNWQTNGEVEGTEGAWLRIFLKSSGQQIIGMMISLTDQKDMKIKAERSEAEWREQQAKEAESALEAVKFK